jgi:hypothetical protein
MFGYVSLIGVLKMHPDEVDIDIPLVRRLVAAQFPQWAHLPIQPVLPSGTDNALYRLSDEMVVRLPRREPSDKTLERSANGCRGSLRTCRWPSLFRGHTAWLAKAIPFRGLSMDG